MSEANNTRIPTRNMTKVDATALRSMEATDTLDRNRSESTGRRYHIAAEGNTDWRVQIFDTFPDGKIVTVATDGPFDTYTDALASRADKPARRWNG